MENNFYEYNNAQPTMLSIGCLIENLRIAATKFGREMLWEYHEFEGHSHQINVTFRTNLSTKEDPLCSFIMIRSVDRRHYQLKRLTSEQKSILEAVLGDDLEIRWFQSFRDRWRVSRINALATDARLRIREAYAIHTRIFEWDRLFSPDAIPVAAIGLDTLTLRIMHWALKDWRRMDIMNRYFGATCLPRLQLDWLPGLLCSAHFAIALKEQSATDMDPKELICAGRQLQKFWLTATYLGLALQPNLAPLCIGYHCLDFETLKSPQNKVFEKFRRLTRANFIFDPMKDIFIGRIGTAKSISLRSRSIRRKT